MKITIETEKETKVFETDCFAGVLLHGENPVAMFMNDGVDIFDKLHMYVALKSLVSKLEKDEPEFLFFGPILKQFTKGVEIDSMKNIPNSNDVLKEKAEDIKAEGIKLSDADIIELLNKFRSK